MTKYHLGALVSLVRGPEWERLLGLIVGGGTRCSPMYGGGILEETYVQVRWLHQKYPRIASYTNPGVSLRVVSSIPLTSDAEFGRVVR